MNSRASTIERDFTGPRCGHSLPIALPAQIHFGTSVSPPSADEPQMTFPALPLRRPSKPPSVSCLEALRVLLSGWRAGQAAWTAVVDDIERACGKATVANPSGGGHRIMRPENEAAL